MEIVRIFTYEHVVAILNILLGLSRSCLMMSVIKSSVIKCTSTLKAQEALELCSLRYILSEIVILIAVLHCIYQNNPCSKPVFRRYNFIMLI